MNEDTDKKYSVTISRNSQDMVGITVRDNISRIKFLELELTIEDFGWLITGLSEVKADGVVTGLEFVGKKKITESRSVEVPEELKYNKTKAEQWIKENCQEDGWILSSYLGSKDSFVGNIAKYSVYKYE